MNYLNIVQYRDLQNWSVQYLTNTKIGYTNAYPMARIGDFLTRNKTAIDIIDNVTYKRVTIKTNGGGVDVRDEKEGKNIGTKKQFIVREGQFIVSKIDARNGAFGVVPKKADQAVITGNFWTFDVNRQIILPEYLALLTSTKEFKQFAEDASNGTTNRHYLQESLFLAQQIPIPSFEEQIKIVTAYNTLQEQAKICSALSYGVDVEIEEYLHDKLGTNIELNLNDSLLSFVHYKDISRWDPLFLLSSSNIHSKYPLVTLNDCINNFMYDRNGASLRIETKKTPSKEYKYIGMENVEKETGQVIDAPIVKGKEIKSQTIKVPTKYFIYGKLRPYLNKYWYNDIEQEEDIICSSEFFVFDIKENINTNYFKYVLASYIVQKQIIDAMSGARMPRISEGTFRSIQIPLPPLDAQNEIVQHISSLREKQKVMREQATQRRSQSIQQFEQKIYR